jgi:hypothetical protein
MTTAEQFDPDRPEQPYLRIVADGERAPRVDIDADGRASFARAINDARGHELIPVEPAPVELTDVDLWNRIARLEEDREVLSGRVDELRDRLDAFEEVALRMRVVLDPVSPTSHDVWHLRAVVAQLRDLLG